MTFSLLYIWLSAWNEREFHRNFKGYRYVSVELEKGKKKNFVVISQSPISYPTRGLCLRKCDSCMFVWLFGEFVENLRKPFYEIMKPKPCKHLSTFRIHFEHFFLSLHCVYTEFTIRLRIINLAHTERIA